MIDSQLHFIVMFAVTAILGNLLGRRPGGHVFALTIAMLLACGKEMYDLVVNPWNLPMAELSDDIVKDLFCDSLGIVFGTLLWWR